MSFKRPKKWEDDNMSKIYSNEVITFDKETGEVIEHTETKYREVNIEPNYVKVYVDTVIALLGKSKTSKEADVLLILAQNMTYMNEASPNKVNFDKFLKDHIIEKLGIKEGTLKNMMTDFVKRDIIRRVGKGVYQLNPFMFAKGNWSAIRKIQMEWSDEGFKTKIEIEDSTFRGIAFPEQRQQSEVTFSKVDF